jgi:hypothetical protein
MRLRISTDGLGEVRPTPKGQNLVVRLGKDGPRLDGVRSVTVHCDGRHKPVTAVLIVDGVLLDVEADLTPAASAAIRLLRATEAEEAADKDGGGA